ncbi:MAG: hypothetical protein P0107_03330 [Nitrosomonas sp.]|nr:hypothetical protein [Nitrosomonas sp.]
MKADIRKFALFMPVSMIYAASGTELMAVEDAYLPHARRSFLEELGWDKGREGIDVTTHQS